MARRDRPAARPTRRSFRRAPAPRWPPWYAAVGFLVALSATLIAVGIVSVFIAGFEDGRPRTTPRS